MKATLEFNLPEDQEYFNHATNGFNVFGLGEGGLVGCSILAECFCPLLPSPCYMKCRLIYDEAQLEH